MKRQPMICGIDIETTGFDPEKDFITEMGWVIKRWRDPKPFEVRSFICKGAAEIDPIIQEITKITPHHVEAAGIEPQHVYHRWLQDCVKHEVDYLVAHNGNAFDWPFLQRYAERLGFSNLLEMIAGKPWLDTMTDIVYPTDCNGLNLIYISAYLGFLNPFPHAAVFDAFATLKVLECFELKDVAARALEPWVVVRALVKAPFNDDAPTGEKEVDKAKARRYRWQDCGDGRLRDKCWVKRIKQSDLEGEMKEAPFQVVELKD